MKSKSAPNNEATCGCLTRLVRRDAHRIHEQNPEVQLLKAALNRAGYDARPEDIEWAWEQHSEDWAVGWLVLESCGGADGGVKYLLEYLIPANA